MPNPFYWFPCEPSALLGALAGMRPSEAYVYTVVLLRIYESGGLCKDTVDCISTRTRFNRKVVNEALESLLKAGRLYRADGGIRNPKADGIISSANGDFEKRKTHSKNAAISRWRKHKQKQQNDDARAMPNDAESESQLDSLFPNGKRLRLPETESGKVAQARKPKPAKPEPASDWPADYQDQFWAAYPRRTEKKAAIAKLEAVKKSGKIPWEAFLAAVRRYARHVAGTEDRYIKHPMTWLNRGCWDDEVKEGQSGLFGNGGSNETDRRRDQPKQGRTFATFAAELRYGAERTEAADCKPSNGYRNPEGSALPLEGPR